MAEPLKMRNGSPDIHPSPTPARRRLVALVLAAGLLAVLAFAVASAPAVTLQKKLQKGQAALSKVQGEQSDLEAQIDADNARVDDLIAQLAATRARAQQVRAELDAAQAKLEQATKDLKAGQARLAELRIRLHKAVASLSRELVSIYKSGDPQAVDMVLGSASFSDLEARSEYLGAVQSYQDSVTGRVRELRNQAQDEVERLKTARQRMEDARDAIAAREDRIQSMQSAMQAQHDALLAAQQERQSRIDALQGQEQSIQDNLGNITTKLQQQRIASGEATSIPTPSGSVPAPDPGQTATLLSNGQAVPPAGAPPAVVAAINAANSIATTPYIWGGGHGSFESSGYDCSGAVSFALHGAGLLDSPLDSTGLETWGEDGPGNWISVYGNSGHAWMIIAGLRFDTAAHDGASGPRWSSDIYAEDASAFVVRHWPGY